MGLGQGKHPHPGSCFLEEVMIYKQGLRARQVIEQQEKRVHTLDKTKAEKCMHECVLVRVPGEPLSAAGIYTGPSFPPHTRAQGQGTQSPKGSPHPRPPFSPLSPTSCSSSDSSTRPLCSLLAPVTHFQLGHQLAPATPCTQL